MNDFTSFSVRPEPFDTQAVRPEALEGNGLLLRAGLSKPVVSLSNQVNGEFLNSLSDSDNV